jgi:uncharacterized protein YbjT (DUF2867 family)
MSAKTAAIIGASGMIGGYLLEQLLNDPDYETIRVIVRRPFDRKHAKVEVKLVDFADYESFKLAIDGSDVVFCAIGTTQKNVKGDKTLYRKIDFDIPVKAARICKETGCQTFVVVSSVGADSTTGNFYLKLKGEVEDALAQSGLEEVHIMQPSQLLGDRKENRPAEKIFKAIMKTVSPLLGGSLAKYKPIHGRDVAKAMIKAAKTNNKGVHRYSFHELMKLAN